MPPEAVLESHHFEALGTSCSLFAVGRPRASLLAAESWVLRLGDRFTRFASDSELSRLNARTGEWVDISGEMEELLREGLRAYEMSAGLVNVAVLPSMLAIGYSRPLVRGPGVATLHAVESLPRLGDVLEVHAGRARLESGAGIDLGGIAKGWMADRLCESLGPNAVANIGGDLRAVGPGPRGEGWPVGVGDRTLLLRDHGAATSSTRRRRWGDLHHLIDPRSGLPARSALEEVSVVASSGFEAEVVAKTALLLGPEFAPAYCAAHAMAWWLGGAA